MANTTKRNEFADFKSFTAKYFGFLKGEGFNEKEEWHGREFSIIYRKEKLIIRVCLEPSTLPFVDVGKIDEPLPNTRLVLSFEDSDYLRKLFKDRKKRIDPKIKRYVDGIVSDENFDRSELDKDYSTWGYKEMEAVIRENANILKRNHKIIKGDFDSNN